MSMYTMPIYFSRRMNVKVSLLISILAISVLTVGLPLACTSTGTQMIVNISKISSTLLDKIATEENAPVNVLIETYTSDYSSVIAGINSVGGKVNYQCKYVNALAARISADRIAQLAKNNDVVKIYLDERLSLSGKPGVSLMPEMGGAEDLDSLVGIPNPLETEEYETIFITPEQLASLKPSTYWNPTAMGAVDVWEEGYYGQGSLAVIIDTGIWTQHFMFAGTSVVGGIDLSFDVGTDYEGWDKETNHWHGSHVAGILAGTGGILLPETHPLVIAIELYTGIPLPPGDPYGYPGYKLIWLLGMAPLADLYIVKIFDHTGASIPEWLVLEGIEHVIDLKAVYGVDVDVVSMSIGGPTLYDGRDVEDQLIDYATSVGISMVAAAGNEGPASMTTSSPGSANTAITVGAAANPVNTRVFWDYYYEASGIGYYLYKAEVPQIYAFSSRGPTSDGRLKPTVAATGIYVLSAYIPGQGLAWASGTSMSTPAVSGTVALINSYAEEKITESSPEDYRQAIISGAVWLDGYTERDQGAGYLNAYYALEALKADESLGDVAPELPPYGWLEPIANIPIFEAGTYTASIEELEPGHKVEYIFYVSHLTDSIRLDLTNVYLGKENPLRLNSFEVYLQSAKRTMYAYYIDSANVWTRASFLITDYVTTWTGRVTDVYLDLYTRLAPIEPGYVKIIIENDWTSYDKVSANIEITVKARPIPKPDIVISGTIDQDEAIGWIPIEVPRRTKKAIIQLTWLSDWSMYPTTDLDLYVYWDKGYNYNGATLNSPERVILEKPTYLYVLIHGYAIYTGYKEPYILTIWFIK